MATQTTRLSCVRRFRCRMAQTLPDPIGMPAGACPREAGRG